MPVSESRCTRQHSTRSIGARPALKCLRLLLQRLLRRPWLRPFRPRMSRPPRKASRDITCSHSLHVARSCTAKAMLNERYLLLLNACLLIVHPGKVFYYMHREVPFEGSEPDLLDSLIQRCNTDDDSLQGTGHFNTPANTEVPLFRSCPHLLPAVFSGGTPLHVRGCLGYEVSGALVQADKSM